MRKKIVAGNWKMNMNLQGGVTLAKEINEALVADKPNCDVVICTPFIMASVAQVLDSEIVVLVQRTAQTRLRVLSLVRFQLRW